MEQDHLEEGQGQEEAWAEAAVEAEWAVIAREQDQLAIVSALAAEQKSLTK
ncbi:unnamed protein product [marine sediment metagenome]|uniref:Uncharacterized protein n=1 Tax=marine sediment metagenome TaxID=412755 RepID=X1LTW2_9ZZZZ